MYMCNISMIFIPTNGWPMQGNRQVSCRISKSDDLPWGIRLLPQARGSARLGPRHRCVPSWVEPPIIMPLKVAGHWFFRAGLFVGYIHTYNIFMYTIYIYVIYIYISYIYIYISHIYIYIIYIYVSHIYIYHIYIYTHHIYIYIDRYMFPWFGRCVTGQLFVSKVHGLACSSRFCKRSCNHSHISSHKTFVQEPFIDPPPLQLPLHCPQFELALGDIPQWTFAVGPWLTFWAWSFLGGHFTTWLHEQASSYYWTWRWEQQVARQRSTASRRTEEFDTEGRSIRSAGLAILCLPPQVIWSRLSVRLVPQVLLLYQRQVLQGLM